MLLVDVSVFIFYDYPLYNVCAVHWRLFNALGGGGGGEVYSPLGECHDLCVGYHQCMMGGVSQRY